MKNKDVFKVDKKNIIELKDERKVCSCGFGYHYWVITKKGLSTPISQKYYNKLINSYRK